DIDEVARPQEGVLWRDDLESDGDHHDGQDHGQDAAVPTADPEPPDPDILAKRLGDELRRDVSRSGPRGCGEIGHHRGVRRTGRGLAGVRGHGCIPIQAMGISPRHWRIRQAGTAARLSYLSSCTPPHSAGRSPRPAPLPPSAPGAARLSGQRPRRRRSGYGRSPLPPTRGPVAVRLGQALSGSAPPRGQRWARRAAPPWNSTSPPWRPPPPAADLQRAKPLAVGSSAPWSPAVCSVSPPLPAPSSPRRAGHGAGAPG